MVPYERNPHFTGRDELLTQLSEKLYETKPKKFNHRIAIYGIGGVGKTQVVIEYVYRYKSQYDGIYWISASDQAALLSGFQEIGSRTGCVPTVIDRKLTEVAKAVLFWLRKQERWLLVIDNLDDISVADGYLPEIHEGGHTLITTRNPDSMKIPAQGVEIPVLGEEAAIELLRVRSNNNDTEYSSSERLQAAELVKELGFLALAIEQASAFIRSSIYSIPEFLQIYYKSRKRFLRRKPEGNYPYPNSVAATFLLSVDKVKEMENGANAIKLLHMLSFLNPDGILIYFLKSGCQGLSDELREIVEDELVFRDTLELLQQFSLVRLSQKDNIVIHRLIQAVMKDELLETELYAYSSEVIHLCDKIFPKTVTNETMDLCRRFQNQVLEPVIEAAGVIRSLSASEFLTRISMFLKEDGKYGDSERLDKLSLDIDKTLLGDEHPDTLMSMNNLALTYWHQGKLREAADLEEKVLEERRRIQGEEHPDTLRNMNNLAMTYRDQGKLQEAADMQEKVLEAGRRIQGEEHPDTLRNMNNLAMTYRDQGKLQEAADLQEKVLEAGRRIQGEEYPDTLRNMNNLALTYRDQGKFQEAADMQEKVLEAGWRIQGEEHPDILRNMNNLAMTYRDQGKLQEAADLHEKVLEAGRRIHGEEHRVILTNMNNLALTYRDQGKLQEAADMQEKVLEAGRRILGEEHPDILTNMNNLAMTYRDQGKFQEAADMQEKVSEAGRRILGEEHPVILTNMNNLAMTYRDQGKLQEAADIQEKVLEAGRRILGEEHPDTLRNMNNLAMTYRDQGTLQEAADMQEKVLEAGRRIQGEEHPDTLRNMNNLAMIYRDQGKLQEAADLLEKVLEAGWRILGEEHPVMLTNMNNLASIYRDQGKLQEAVDLEEKV